MYQNVHGIYQYDSLCKWLLNTARVMHQKFSTKVHIDQ